MLQILPNLHAGKYSAAPVCDKRSRTVSTVPSSVPEHASESRGIVAAMLRPNARRTVQAITEVIPEPKSISQNPSFLPLPAAPECLSPSRLKFLEVVHLDDGALGGGLEREEGSMKDEICDSNFSSLAPSSDLSSLVSDLSSRLRSDVD